MDVVDTATRSAGIKSKDIRPELALRRYLHGLGFRFRVHLKELPGQPDIVLPCYRLCIFVHGCFWHRHPSCRFAATPKEFWLQKFAANTARDELVEKQLHEAG
jgi:DNA mismatch endonuclease (patch repair protein)